MIEIREKSENENWENIRNSFYKSLTSPFDGMWDELIHDHSQLWGIYDENRIIGYCCKDQEGSLTNFFLTEKYNRLKFELFKRVLFLLESRHAIVSTNNPDFLVVSLKKSKKMAVHSYLFENNIDAKTSKPEEIEGLNPEIAQEQDLENLIVFCQKNTGGDSNWLKGYLTRLINRKELRLLKKGNKIIGYFEVRSSLTQTNVTDLGVIVDVSFHKKGIGSWLMNQAKSISLAQENIPICSCEHANIGSRKMIENAGFVSKNMILKITF